MSPQAPFPIVTVEGTPYECGVQYGSQAKALIQESVAGYRETFKTSQNLEWNQVLKLAMKFLPAIEKYDPDVIEEMKGIAKGSGQSFEDMLVLQARSELVFMAYAGKRTELEEGCTVMAATPDVTESRHMLIGHNVDWLIPAQKTYVILKKIRKGTPNCVTFLEAGIVGKTGFNDKIVSFGNGMITDKVGAGIPSQIILNRLLSARNVSEAVQLFLPSNRGASVNRVIASAEGVCINIEAAPDAFNYLYPEDGIVVHTNHFLGKNPAICDKAIEALPNTLTRRYTAFRLFAAERGHITKETFKKIFRNHVEKPNSICMHEDEGRLVGIQALQTVASLILDLNELKLDIAKGPPCQNEYVTLDFSDIRK